MEKQAYDTTMKEQASKEMMTKSDADAKAKKAFIAGIFGSLLIIAICIGLFFAARGIISVVNTIRDSNHVTMVETPAEDLAEDTNDDSTGTDENQAGEGSVASQMEDRLPPTEEAFTEKFNEIKELIDVLYYETYSEVELYDNVYDSMLLSLDDPYSDYFTPEEMTLFMESSSGTYEGIGVVVSYSEDGNEVIVVAPYEGAPGDLAGMRPGDVIKFVDGIDLFGMSLEEAVTYIKGEKNTPVVLTIYRPSTEETFDLTIIRDEITEETVFHEVLDDNMGYIRLTGFQEVTDEQFDAALEVLQGEGIEGLIIDLRNNPGGSLDTVLNICDRILGEELIVYTENKYGDRKEYFSDAETYLDLPIVVLVNEYSASASEILSGALKDLGVGTLVGNTTFGKGLVQNIIPLEDGSAVKVTIARYYTPGGNYINEVGIEPDVEVILEDENVYMFDTEHDEDVQLQKAIEVLGDIIGE